MVMPTSNQYEEQTKKLLNDTKCELDQIEAQICELQNKRDVLASEAQAYETALQGYRRRIGKSVPARNEWFELLNGKPHKEKILVIAQQNGGAVKVGQAADILYQSGLIQSKSRNNAYMVLQRTFSDLVETGELQKVAPAEYKLVNTQQSLIN